MIELTTLAHESGNDTVKRRRFESKSLFSSAQGAEVLGGLRHNIGTQFHDDTSGRGSADGHIKKYFRVAPTLIETNNEIE